MLKPEGLTEAKTCNSNKIHDNNGATPRQSLITSLFRLSLSIKRIKEKVVAVDVSNQEKKSERERERERERET